MSAGTPAASRVAAALGIIQKVANRQGNVTTAQLAERLGADDSPLVRVTLAEGWDAAVREAEDCGLINDVFADEVRGRNPYREDR